LHIAIDDTYGPEASGPSRYVTGGRRSHVAVVFSDDEVDQVRSDVLAIYDQASSYLPSHTTRAGELHFVDIYNRKVPWNMLPDRANLAIFSVFAEFYTHHRWQVLLQTMDDRTLSDHNVKALSGKVDGLDLSKREDLSLIFLLTQILDRYEGHEEPLRLILDQGRRKPGVAFGQKLFRRWQGAFSATYENSKEEPLLQIADFIAFCINRSTHLALKPSRSAVDVWFIDLVGRMRINCPDIVTTTVDADFSIEEFDSVHDADRRAKGLALLVPGGKPGKVAT
jgi:hypothetical protein